MEPLEFLDRLKAVALEFNKLTDTQKMILKHWIRNTVDETIAENAVKILEVNKEGVEKMVASNAFMIKEMKEKVEKEGIEKGLEKEREANYIYEPYNIGSTLKSCKDIRQDLPYTSIVLNSYIWCSAFLLSKIKEYILM